MALVYMAPDRLQTPVANPGGLPMGCRIRPFIFSGMAMEGDAEIRHCRRFCSRECLQFQQSSTPSAFPHAEPKGLTGAKRGRAPGPEPDFGV